MDILVITIVVFVLVVLAVMAVFYALTAAKESPKYEVRRRLRSIALRQPTDEVMPSVLKEEILSDIPALNLLLYNMPLARKAESLLDQADSTMKVGTLFLLTLVLFFVGLLLGILLHKGVLLGLLIALVFTSAPYFYFVNKKNARLRRFTEQFPDTLDMIARSLRAGHSFTSAMQIVSQEMPDPVAKLFRMAYDEQNLGLSISESLTNMTRRIDSVDLAFFVTAVNIQRETGGNLAEILEKLGTTIRERFRILGQLRIYTAQGRLSGYILFLIPVVLAIIIWVINRPYLMILVSTKLGVYMIVAAVTMQAVGFLVIRKIINIQI